VPDDLPRIPAGTVVKLNGIPLELAIDAPVHGNVELASRLDAETSDSSLLGQKGESLVSGVWMVGSPSDTSATLPGPARGADMEAADLNGPPAEVETNSDADATAAGAEAAGDDLAQGE
jgi:hypothetical protein